MDLDLSHVRWNAISSSERNALAKQLAHQLPTGFQLHSLQTYTLGNKTREIAEFSFDRAQFTLIPGVEAVLGYDASRPWEPTSEELESWNQSAEEYGIKWTIHEHIGRATLRPRKVVLRPLLMETIASEVCWKPLPAEDHRVQEVLKRLKSIISRRKTTQLESGSIRILFGEDGGITAMKSRPLTHGDLSKEWRTKGFRLPTSDEWEFACGASSPSLFRWGDHVPCDGYPIDRMAWNHHIRPNAFGVFIASNPYHFELVAETGVSRGGDGGCTICGGAGFFLGWLTLATAYFEAHSCKYDPSKPLLAGYTIGRRVFPL
jgi:hypothetical protein